MRFGRCVDPVPSGYRLAAAGPHLTQPPSNFSMDRTHHPYTFGSSGIILIILVLLVCAQCAGVFSSSVARWRRASPRFSFGRTFFHIYLDAFCYMPSK